MDPNPGLGQRLPGLTDADDLESTPHCFVEANLAIDIWNTVDTNLPYIHSLG